MQLMKGIVGGAARRAPKMRMILNVALYAEKCPGQESMVFLASSAYPESAGSY
ncbi:MAG: hypothetical protein QM772_10915 [Ottowia sp.]|uniref:hypothetical protein n=1 Tax=Ottowia sp. TaxID=1898956 RepID=UPI0039E45571